MGHDSTTTGDHSLVGLRKLLIALNDLDWLRICDLERGCL